MNSKTEFIKVEKRIRALTTMLNNLNHHVAPTSRSKAEIPVFFCHIATLLTIGDSYSPDTKKVIAVTGILRNNGTL